MALCFAIYSFSYAQYTAVPDTNFEQQLINAGIDTNPILDGQVLTAAANAHSVTLNISNKGITDLTGIEAFTNIPGLIISWNTGITSLDLSNCTALQVVRGIGCSGLTSINVSDLINLTEINFRNSALTSLDVSSNAALETLIIRNNYISSLDLSQNSALTFVDVKTNHLTFLDMRNGNNANVIPVGTDPAIPGFNSDFNPGLECILIDDINTPVISSWIIASNSCFCEDLGVCLTISVAEVKNLSYNMYPNPTNDYLYISSKTNNSSINIYNITGKMVLSKTLAQGENIINVSNLASGIYLTRFASNNQVDTKKLIIQ